ncbi:hypothetical protein BDK51DRAFT_29742, partial [Blyttiomyces helicus]
PSTALKTDLPTKTINCAEACVVERGGWISAREKEKVGVEGGGFGRKQSEYNEPGPGSRVPGQTTNHFLTAHSIGIVSVGGYFLKAAGGTSGQPGGLGRGFSRLNGLLVLVVTGLASAHQYQWGKTGQRLLDEWSFKAWKSGQWRGERSMGPGGEATSTITI